MKGMKRWTSQSIRKRQERRHPHNSLRRRLRRQRGLGNGGLWDISTGGKKGLIEIVGSCCLLDRCFSCSAAHPRNTPLLGPQLSAPKTLAAGVLPAAAAAFEGGARCGRRAGSCLPLLPDGQSWHRVPLRLLEDPRSQIRGRVQEMGSGKPEHSGELDFLPLGPCAELSHQHAPCTCGRWLSKSLQPNDALKSFLASVPVGCRCALLCAKCGLAHQQATSQPVAAAVAHHVVSVLAHSAARPPFLGACMQIAQLIRLLDSSHFRRLGRRRGCVSI